MRKPKPTTQVKETNPVDDTDRQRGVEEDTENLTDEQYVRMLALDILDQIEQEKASSNGINGLWRDHEKQIFSFNVVNEGGILNGTYEPLRTIELLIRAIDRITEKVSLEEKWTYEQSVRKLRAFATDATSDLLSNFVQIQAAALHLNFNLALVQALRREIDPLNDNVAFVKEDRGETIWIEKQLEEFNKRIKQLILAPERGRPAKWTKNNLGQVIRHAIREWKKKNRYRNPTLAQTVSEINKSQPMTIVNMKQLLSRHNLRYSQFKKDT